MLNNAKQWSLHSCTVVYHIRTSYIIHHTSYQAQHPTSRTTNHSSVAIHHALIPSGRLALWYKCRFIASVNPTYCVCQFKYRPSCLLQPVPSIIAITLHLLQLSLEAPNLAALLRLFGPPLFLPLSHRSLGLLLVYERGKGVAFETTKLGC